MQFFTGLSHELSSSRTNVQKNIRTALQEAKESGDSDAFYQLMRNSFYTDVAFHEQGRVNHSMLKTTFDSFQ